MKLTYKSLRRVFSKAYNLIEKRRAELAKYLPDDIGLGTVSHQQVTEYWLGKMKYCKIKNLTVTMKTKIAEINIRGVWGKYKRSVDILVYKPLEGGKVTEKALLLVLVHELVHACLHFGGFKNSEKATWRIAYQIIASNR